MAADDIIFDMDPPRSQPQSVAITEVTPDNDQIPSEPYPDAILQIGEERLKNFKIWLNEWLETLSMAHQEKLAQWAEEEILYRALPEPPKKQPFVGASNDVVPVVAMAVDPIHARLDTGIFKADPVFKLKALKRSWLKYSTVLERWIDYYQKHRLQLRRISAPLLLELTKHGTMILKSVYDVDKYKIKTYDKNWKVIDKDVTRFKGPRVVGISIKDLLFPAGYQQLQDCPFVAEIQRPTFGMLKMAEHSNKLANVDVLKDQAKYNTKDDLDLAREESSNHSTSLRDPDLIEIYEIWCDYDIDGDGIPEKLVVTYHRDTQEILQLRYNWYFHQRKPYTVIPYSIVNGSLYGLGICEMSAVFQRAQTKWHQMATDNAYLANIRMFIAKTDSNIEEVPKLYTGRVFFVDNPQTDFIPFQVADIYNSTLQERQNIFGLAEKRTGVSDYLTGRESPIVGSRATATSTMALIQEGTRRVEEVLENIRLGMADVISNCFYIWIQYGLDGLDDLVLDEEDVNLLREFFGEVDEFNMDGALAIDLAATDAATNRSVQQQVQLAIIQVMMQYLEKLVQLGQMAAGAAAQGDTTTAAMAGEVMRAARKMFTDLLEKYDIRNPEEYLPDLERILNGGTSEGQAGQGGSVGLPSGPGSLAGFSAPDAVPPQPTGFLPPGAGIPGFPA